MLAHGCKCHKKIYSNLNNEETACFKINFIRKLFIYEKYKVRYKTYWQ